MIARASVALLAAGLVIAGSSPSSRATPERSGGTSEALQGPATPSRLPIYPVPRPDAAAVADRLPAAPNNLLVYYGGRVISNVKVYAVFWGPQVDPTITGQIGAFYAAVTDSPFIDWLEEYDTIGKTGMDGLPGSNQHIGRGSFGAAITITPVNTATTLSEVDIGNELAAQIAAQKLPAPDVDANGNVNAIYMFDFPKGITFTLLGSSTSCQQFCAYHFSKVIGGKDVPFGVHPDISDCGNACGAGFAVATSIHSHELAEAITDAEAGLINFNGALARPAGWYCDAQNCGEIGDICNYMNAGDATIAGFTVQKVWSNSEGACVASISLCTGPSSPAGCRPCTKYDDGAACNGATPVCETTASSPKYGTCVACVDSTGCMGATPICDRTTDTCRACTMADCSLPTAVCTMAGANAGSCVQCDATSSAACTAATPQCDTTQNKCVGCVDSTTCPPATPICDPTAHTCRGCQSAADCKAPTPACDTSGDPSHGQCVACVADGDCTPGTCDMATHTCQPAAGPDGGVFGSSDGGGPLPASPTGGSSSSSGCGCRIAGAGGSSAPAAGLGLVVALALIGRRRRRDETTSARLTSEEAARSR